MKPIGLFCLGAFLFVTCNQPKSDDMFASQSKQTVVNSQGHLDEAKASPFGVREIRLKRPESTRIVYFSENTYGWLGGGGKLSKTEDGGRTWKEVEVDVPQGSDVEKILFLNPSMGWVVTQTISKDPSVRDCLNLTTQLLHTSDGGESWSLQFEGKQLAITQIAFSDKQDGWLVGIRYLDPNGTTYTYVALHTTDLGRHWSDVSDALVRVTPYKKDVSGAPINDALMGVVARGPLGADVITGRMRVFGTTDAGKNWHLRADLNQELVQSASIRRFGVIANRLWIVRSLDAEEGIGGEFAVEESNDTWKRSRLGGVYFSDAVSLSDREFLACGYIKRVEKMNSYQHGAIFYSPDGGSNWSIVYRNRDMKSINALTAADSNHAWGVGEGGLILRLERSSTKPLE